MGCVEEEKRKDDAQLEPVFCEWATGDRTDRETRLCQVPQSEVSIPLSIYQNIVRKYV